MSRPAMAKSRAEKARASVPVPIPSVNVQQILEIVPGRFTETDWIAMVTLEEGEENVGEIMDDLVSQVMKHCFQVYLQRQRIPYTISQAKDATIQIIEWRFLVRDTGEACVAKDDSWQEEREPMSAITDSWAQGTVPVIHSSFIPHMEDEQLTLDEPNWINLASTPIIPTDECRLLELSASQPQSSSLGEESEVTTSEKMSTVEKAVEEMKSPSRSQEPVYQPVPSSQQQKPKQEYKPHPVPLRPTVSKSIKPLKASEKETQQPSQTVLKEDSQEDVSNLKQPVSSLQNIMKAQLGRHPHRKVVIYDEFGNIISVPKLDPSHLPVSCIQPQVEILSSCIETERQRADTIGINRFKSRKVSIKKTGQKGETTKDRSSFPQPSSADAMSRHMVKGKSNVPITLKSGILVEAMQLAPGVVMRDNSSTARSTFRGPKQEEATQEECIEKESERDLRPVLTTVPTPSITVDQLLKNHTPQVQPITRFQTNPSSLRGHS
ncbi:uncharacterized protein C2orf81 homolog [Microcaecilia unicolor]|uniref:Uncharacterized protein C2orf81 homolog n=1 Tax=Microcaecilia unicolor TaxID=1415580 RepID=A0A6P7X875_9AMPH|nr:uncharacterized protein C2orf81 homolog [Microcaecilia unicolor]